MGSPIIARKMMEVKAIFGGEGNGGMLFPDYQFCRDGLATAVNMVAMLRESGERLSRHVAMLPKYHMRRWKVPCPMDEAQRSLSKLHREFPEGRMVDGLLVEQKDHWVLFRPSGTEPIMRLTLETRDSGKVDGLLRKYKDALTASLPSSS